MTHSVLKHYHNVLITKKITYEMLYEYVATNPSFALSIFSIFSMVTAMLILILGM